MTPVITYLLVSIGINSVTRLSDGYSFSRCLLPFFLSRKSVIFDEERVKMAIQHVVGSTVGGGGGGDHGRKLADEMQASNSEVKYYAQIVALKRVNGDGEDIILPEVIEDQLMRNEDFIRDRIGTHCGGD